MSKNCCVKWAMKFSIIWRNLWNFKLYSNKFLKTNSEKPLCRVSCQGARQKFSMSSVWSGHSAKSDFAEFPDLALGELSLCRVPDRGTRQSQRHLVAAPAHALTHTQQTHSRRTSPPPPEEEDLGPAPAPCPAPGAPQPQSAATAKTEEEELGPAPGAPVPAPALGASRPRAPL